MAKKILNKEKTKQKEKTPSPKEKLLETLPKDYLFLQASVQDFIPFEKIKDMMICLPGNLYRSVIEVKSINYYLKTLEEQESLENMFRNALSSWDFSFAFYTQTRTIDSEEIIRILKKDIDKTTTRELQVYGENYIEEMEKLTKARNGNLIKKNYIILACNDANLINPNVTDSEKETYAFDKLSLNVRKVYESLAPMGLVCNVLSNEELIELLFVAINKHSLLKAQQILDFTTKITTGPSEWDINKVDMMMEGMINQLRNMMLRSHDLSASEYDKAQEIIKELEDMRSRNKTTGDDLFVL